MLLHIFTTKANHPQALMKIKPAILSLLPSATASGLAVSTLSGYGTAWPSNSSPGAKGLQTGSRTFVVGDGLSFSAEAVYYLRSYGVVLILAVIGATPLPKRVIAALSENRKLTRSWNVLEPLLLTGLLLVVTAYLVDGSFNPFLYFRF